MPNSQSDYFDLTFFFKPNQRFGGVQLCSNQPKLVAALMLYEPLLRPVD
jgi:hypothetical protein